MRVPGPAFWGISALSICAACSRGRTSAERAIGAGSRVQARRVGTVLPPLGIRALRVGASRFQKRSGGRLLRRGCRLGSGEGAWPEATEEGIHE